MPKSSHFYSLSYSLRIVLKLQPQPTLRGTDSRTFDSRTLQPQPTLRGTDSRTSGLSDSLTTTKDKKHLSWRFQNFIKQMAKRSRSLYRNKSSKKTIIIWSWILVIIILICSYIGIFHSHRYFGFDIVVPIFMVGFCSLIVLNAIWFEYKCE